MREKTLLTYSFIYIKHVPPALMSACVLIMAVIALTVRHLSSMQHLSVQQLVFISSLHHLLSQPQIDLMQELLPESAEGSPSSPPHPPALKKKKKKKKNL